MPVTSKKEKSSRGLKGVVAGGMVTLSCLGALHLLRNVTAVAATSTLPIRAKLVRAIEVTVETSLDFGTVAMTVDQVGVASIDPALNRLVVDSNSSFSAAGGTPNAGRLRIKGVAFPVSVSLEDSIVNLTNGATLVTVNDFNFFTANGGSRVTITPQAGNHTMTVPVGATLNAKAGQATGSYVGTARIYTNFQ